MTVSESQKPLEEMPPKSPAKKVLAKENEVISKKQEEEQKVVEEVLKEGEEGEGVSEEEEKVKTMDDDELLEYGKKMFGLEKFADAVGAFSALLERQVAKFEGDELNVRLGDIWVLYGRACYKNANANIGVLQDEMLKEATTGVNIVSTPQKQGKIVLAEEDDEDDDEEGEWEDEDENNFSAEDVLNDFQMAWEALETARVIFSKDSGSFLKLADVHLMLADMSLDEQRLDAAISDYQAALDIRKTTLPSYDRRVSEAAYMLASALEADERFEEALIALTLALKGLEERQRLLEENLHSTDDKPSEKGKESAEKLTLSKAQATEELDDLKTLIPEIKTRFEDVSNFAKEKYSIGNSSSSSVATASVVQSAVAAPVVPAKVNDISALVKKRKAEPVKKDDSKRSKNDGK